jgi:hypothetical protein
LARQVWVNKRFARRLSALASLQARELKAVGASAAAIRPSPSG